MLFLANVTTTQALGLLGRGYDDNVGLLTTPLLSPDVRKWAALGLPWAADNGAYSGFDANKFRCFLQGIHGISGCLFVVCPDKVTDARTTISMYDEWEGEILAFGHNTAFVLQDGQEDLELPDADAYFVGGSTRFKLSASADILIKECKRRGRWVHMGRVNSKRRIRHAHVRGIDSIDGTCMRFAGFGIIHTMCEYMSMLDTYKRIKDNKV